MMPQIAQIFTDYKTTVGSFLNEINSLSVNKIVKICAIYGIKE